MPVLSYIQRRELPSAPGIYYLGNHDCPVMYIGLAHNLKKRHMNHHRQVQFDNIENAVIYYRVLAEDVLVKISNLKEVLIRLEKQSISQYGSVKAERLITDVKFRSFNSLSSTSVFWLFRTKL
ncbi:MAG: GIY-YIG nuclease family protein [Desmonostoc geniculatum HA4340-LM1]|jgi:excinuclease UvrABC nuclease subunit|nr:GIY-YIG nuclease family protein [Desmonostoc geniculatum HA4340-LM1]